MNFMDNYWVGVTLVLCMYGLFKVVCLAIELIAEESVRFF